MEGRRVREKGKWRGREGNIGREKRKVEERKRGGEGSHKLCIWLCSHFEIASSMVELPAGSSEVQGSGGPTDRGGGVRRKRGGSEEEEKGGGGRKRREEGEEREEGEMGEEREEGEKGKLIKRRNAVR